MATGRISGSITIAGMSFTFEATRTDEGVIHQDTIVPKAYAAVVTSGVCTRAGVITTTDEAPEITTDDYVDIYWTLAGVDYVLYNADVSDVTAGAVTIIDTNGLGSVLPANATPCIIAVRHMIVSSFLGTNVSIVAMNCNQGKSHIAFCEGTDETDVVEHLARIVPNGEGWFFADGLGLTNPITGDDITHIFVSTADVAADQQITVGVLYDSVV